MEPATIALITAGIPFATKLVKKVFRTDNKPKAKGWNALLPVLLGVAACTITAINQGSDLVTAIAIGVGTGGAASSVRDIDKNLTKLLPALAKLISKKK